MTNFGHFSHCANPRLNVELRHQPRVSAHPVGRDQRIEVDIRWGCYKLALDNEADALYLWELLGGALGRIAPIIRTVPVHPVAPAAGDGPSTSEGGAS